MSHDVPASSRCRVATKPPPPHARLHPLSTQVQRRKPEPTRKKTETRNKAEAGKKCMSGRRVEERVKSNEATKGTRGSQRPSKGRAQGRGHGRHTASTTPHRDTGEGSTRGTREERHHAPRHARHRNHTHRTHPTSPGSPPSSGRAVGGTAPDLRRPSQWWKAPPPGDALPPPPQRATPARKGARCGAGAGSPRPHRPHPRHTGRGTLAARPRGRAAGGGTAPDTRRPSQRWQATLPGTAPHQPRGTQPPQGMQAKGTVLGPHTHTPAPTARGWRTPTARQMGRQSGEGQRLTPGAPHNGGRHPPRGRPSATPTASNASPQGRTLRGRCWVPTPARTAPVTHGTRNPGRPLQRTGGLGRDSA